MFTLHAIDWLIIGLYVVLALGVGVAFKGRAGRNRTSYFLAGRTLPWWWVGASMAATTFAADTPLAVTGIIADKGLSGNWLWIPVALHKKSESCTKSRSLTDRKQGVQVG